MNSSQMLSSGILIRQDFRKSARFVFFETNFVGWEYATHGGTAFVINFRDQAYALTCTHVRQDFSWSQLAITDEKFGASIAGIEAVYFPSAPEGAAVGSDVLDVAILKLSPSASFFKDTSYIIDSGTMASSTMNSRLKIYGALKSQSEIGESRIKPVFCEFDLIDKGISDSDVTLRKAEGKVHLQGVADITGISGAPVFNLSSNRLCGMVVRGGINGLNCTVYYVDVFDILKVIEGVHGGKVGVRYEKAILRPRS